jgi:hypothetical protein
MQWAQRQLYVKNETASTTSGESLGKTRDVLFRSVRVVASDRPASVPRTAGRPPSAALRWATWPGWNATVSAPVKGARCARVPRHRLRRPLTGARLSVAKSTPRGTLPHRHRGVGGSLRWSWFSTWPPGLDSSSESEQHGPVLEPNLLGQREHRSTVAPSPFEAGHPPAWRTLPDRAAIEAGETRRSGASLRVPPASSPATERDRSRIPHSVAALTYSDGHHMFEEPSAPVGRR